MTRPTSSPSVGSITSELELEPTGPHHTVKPSGLTYGTSVEVLVGPAVCQGCGRFVDWVRLDGIRLEAAMFWATSGTDIPHPCIRQPRHMRRPATEGTSLHNVVEQWKRSWLKELSNEPTTDAR